MKTIPYIIIIIFIFTFSSCKNVSRENIKGDLLENKHSRGFEIIENQNGYIIKIKDRFDTSDNSISIYHLNKNDDINNKTDIKIPVRKVVCLSTTHCAFISKLDETLSIKGVSGVDYIYDSLIRNLINEDKVVEVGYDKQINYEKIISLAPDVVFAFGVDNSSISSYQKLVDIGIPVIYVGDFLEPSPLGRTEWIKFFGCFYDKLNYGIEYFDSVENNYNKLLDNDRLNGREKPEVLVGLPWKGTWWVPGGDSFFATFINDAGGNYILKNNTQSESIPHTIEEIFSIAGNIDIWLNPNSVTSRKEIIQTDERLENFRPIYSSNIYNNNKRTGVSGGNDFWESGIVHPDIILNDLRYMFYPDFYPGYTMIYYQKID